MTEHTATTAHSVRKQEAIIRRLWPDLDRMRAARKTSDFWLGKHLRNPFCASSTTMVRDPETGTMVHGVIRLAGFLGAPGAPGVTLLPSQPRTSFSRDPGRTFTWYAGLMGLEPI